jgi:ABC-type transporter MlaC component
MTVERLSWLFLGKSYKSTSEEEREVLKKELRKYVGISSAGDGVEDAVE